jgi:hypothetical protein
VALSLSIVSPPARGALNGGLADFAPAEITTAIWIYASQYS